AALATLVAGGIAIGAGVAERPTLDPLGLAVVGALAVLVAWSGITVLWSYAPDRSWGFFNRGVVYLGLILIGVAGGSLVRRAPTVAAAGLAALLGAALGWALLGKAVPALFPDAGRVARLRAPVGYWNSLALLGAMALPLGLWLASRRAHG